MQLVTSACVASPIIIILDVVNNCTVHVKRSQTEFKVYIINQKTNGPVNAQRISYLVKHKTYKTWKINGKEMTLHFNTHIQSTTQ